jgi:integrase
LTEPALSAPAGLRSPFAGADICAHTGFALHCGGHGPAFDTDVWDFTAVAGLPVQMPRSEQVFDFTAIGDPRWRLIAKELVFALLVPGHEAVALLPGAFRTPLTLRTCHHRLEELTRWFAFLTGRGLTSLDQVDEGCCAAYLAHRSHRRDATGQVTGQNGPSRRAVAIQVVHDLAGYRELFADRLPPGLRPWGGASASRAAGRRHTTENTTPPLTQDVLQPLLAAALYLTETTGPHLAGLVSQYRTAVRQRPPLPSLRRAPARELAAACARHVRDGEPLTELPGSDQQQRLAHGWQPGDPLLAVSLDALAQEAGARVFRSTWIPSLRAQVEDTLARAGCAPAWARNAAAVGRADDATLTPWTLPLHANQLSALAQVTMTASLLVIAALSGMRCGELMELRTGCQRIEQTTAGLPRHKLASSLIKGQPLGGIPEQWVVIEPAYQAAGLAGQLAGARGDPGPGQLLFGRFQFHARYRTFRAFVNGPAGQRLGLAPIPGTPVNLRMLRRTLAIELAYRPGGLLAAKVQLKHIATATTEGYAARPGGAQAQLLAEISSHEQDRNLQLVLTEFRNYQRGILPAGPGARDLTKFFASVDAHLAQAPSSGPRIQHADRDILNLLSKRAKTLHLGVANYCWYADPSQALCHRLAGTPAGQNSAPLANMCDSARCPQATHHACHREIWAEHAATTKTFLGSLGPARAAERTRLTGEYDRAARVVDALDAASAAHRAGTGHNPKET